MHHTRFHRLRFLMPVVVLAVVALATLAVRALWNGVLVDVAPVKVITFWQALGILVLGKILFGGFPGRHCGSCCRWGRRMDRARWESLTPEEREKMRDEMRRRFGDWPRPPWCDEPTPRPEPPRTT